jgi:hypothetical protein
LNERPNHVFSGNFKPMREAKVDPVVVQKEVIENSLKIKAQEIEKYGEMINDADLSVIKNLAKFSNYEIVKKVFQILMVINDASPGIDISIFVEGFDLKTFIKFGNVNMINPTKVGIVSGILQEDKNFNFESVTTFNKKLGVLYKYMVSLVRCYDLNLRYAIVLHQLKAKKQEIRAEERTKTITESLMHQTNDQFKVTKVSSSEFDFACLPSKPKDRGGAVMRRKDEKNPKERRKIGKSVLITTGVGTTKKY